jgi:hypothetical protein
MVYPFLYGTSDLIIKKVGFIMVQVKDDSDVTPNAILFKRMDPFLRELLSKNDKRDFTIPIIRIVFSLGGGKPFLQPMRYNSLEQAEGQSLLTRMDILSSRLTISGAQEWARAYFFDIEGSRCPALTVSWRWR